MASPDDTNQSFDAYLLDLGRKKSRDPLMDSFSTTETASSDWAARASEQASQGTATQPSAVFKEPGMAVHHLPTVDAYDAWASVYDTDGNMLQAVDDEELLTMLPTFLSLIQSDVMTHNELVQKLRVVDCGCGTGRNTGKLLNTSWPDGNVEIIGVDASKGMLDKATEKLEPLLTGERSSAKRKLVVRSDVTLQLLQHDFLLNQSLPPELEQPADALITTLVLEHFPLDKFFESLSSLLRPGGVAFVTNMHGDMGKVSQAGFVGDASLLPESSSDGSEKGPVKIRGESWAHGVDETVEAAQRAGFTMIGEVKEREVNEEMIGQVVGERGRKWIGIKVWYGMMMRKQ